MRAKMKDNLVPRYIALSPELVDPPDESVQEFLTKIEGKEVDLVFVYGDAFEKHDSEIWLPDALWERI